jgi:hypothetical protein
VTYRLTADEAYRARRILLPRWVPIAIGLGAVLLLIAGIALVTSGYPEVGVAILVAPVVVLVSRPIVRWLSMRRISTMLRRVPDPIVVTIDADGIRGQRGSSSSLVGWSDVVSVESRGPFVWVQGRLQPVYAIPRRAFDGNADADRFVAAAMALKQASPRS